MHQVCTLAFLDFEHAVETSWQGRARHRLLLLLVLLANVVIVFFDMVVETTHMQHVSEERKGNASLLERGMVGLFWLRVELHITALKMSLGLLWDLSGANSNPAAVMHRHRASFRLKDNFLYLDIHGRRGSANGRGLPSPSSHGPPTPSTVLMKVSGHTKGHAETGECGMDWALSLC